VSALRACRFGDRWELVRDIDGVGRRVGIVHDKADADRLIASEDLLSALRDFEIVECEACDGTGEDDPRSPGDACYFCGGFGKQIRGGDPNAILAAIAKAEG
jgi:hypothetical protein